MKIVWDEQRRAWIEYPRAKFDWFVAFTWAAIFITSVYLLWQVARFFLRA